MGELVPNHLLSLEEELMCTICFEVSISPISNCIWGHIVCGVCIRQLGRCGHCQGSLILSPLAERLIRKHDVQLPCRFTGCQLLIKAWEMMSHLRICVYRNDRVIKCFEKKHARCGGQIFNLDDFSDHLINYHNCFEVTKKIRLGWCVDFSSHRRFQNTEFCVLPSILFEFDGKMFILHEIHKNSIVYRWMTVIGGDKDAQGSIGYTYCMKMSAKNKLLTTSPTKPYAERSFSWELPVLLLQNYQDYQLLDLTDTTRFARIHIKDLKSICEPSTFKGINYPYRWVTRIQVSKFYTLRT